MTPPQHLNPSPVHQTNTIARRSPYAPVRSVERAIDVLSHLSRMGSGSPSDLARETGLSRATILRLLTTLGAANLVAGIPGQNTYTLAAGVRDLADGYQNDDPVARMIAAEMGALLRDISWPSDFATFEAGSMLIRDSTHKFTPFSPLRTVVGHAPSLFDSSLGWAALSWASPDRQEEMIADALQRAEARGDAVPDPGDIRAGIKETRARGYAEATITEFGVSTAAIALPVSLPGHQQSALNIVFLTGAPGPVDGARDYLQRLRRTVATIETAAMRLAGAQGGVSG